MSAKITFFSTIYVLTSKLILIMTNFIHTFYPISPGTVRICRKDLSLAYNKRIYYERSLKNQYYNGCGSKHPK